MELPTWKGAYCPRCVNPLSMRLFNHARGDIQSTQESHVITMWDFHIKLEFLFQKNKCLDVISVAL